MKTIEDEFNIGSMKIVSCCKNYFYKFQNSHNNENEFNCVHSVNMAIMVITDVTENISRNTVQKHVAFVNEELKVWVFVYLVHHFPGKPILYISCTLHALTLVFLAGLVLER